MDIKEVTHMTFVDISEMRADFCRLGDANAQSDRHWQSQPCKPSVLGEVCHRLVNVFLWQLFPDGLQDSFQLIGRLRLWLEFMVLLPAWHPRHGSPDMLVQCVQIWGVSMNPGQLACSKF